VEPFVEAIEAMAGWTDGAARNVARPGATRTEIAEASGR